MLFGIPFIHTRQNSVRLMNRNDWAFCQNIQVAVSDNCGNFDNIVVIGIETGHFQVNPDQVMFAFGHGLRLFITTDLGELCCH